MERPCRADLYDAAEVLRQSDIGRADVLYRVASWLDQIGHSPERQADAAGCDQAGARSVPSGVWNVGGDAFALRAVSATSGAATALTTVDGPAKARSP